MSRVELEPDVFERWARREFSARARRALQIYRKTPLVRDQPGYPFAQHPGDGSIRDASSSSITPIPGGVRIAVQSRGAPFLEDGNDQSGAFIKPRHAQTLAIPLKRRGRGKKKGRIMQGEDGNLYLAIPRVRTYKGRQQLERSVRAAFLGSGAAVGRT